MSPKPEDLALRLRDAESLSDEDYKRIVLTLLEFVDECGPWIREAIKRDRAREEFRRQMWEKVAGSLVLATILAAVAMAWKGFIGEAHK